MTDSYQQVAQQLLVPTGLTEADMEAALAITIGKGVDYADL